MCRSSLCFALRRQIRGKSCLTEGAGMLDASDRVMAAGIVDVRLLTVVRVSSSSDRCLIVSHQVCKVVTCDRKKLTMVERCRSNHCVNNSVNVFRFMQERKYVCGEQPKIRILQHPGQE